MAQASLVAGRATLRALVAVLAAVALAGCATTLDADLSDAAITARVKLALLNDPETSGSTIEVETYAGVVTLAGRVGSRSIETGAVRVARSVNGVTDIRSRLQVGP